MTTLRDIQTCIEESERMGRVLRQCRENIDKFRVGDSVQALEYELVEPGSEEPVNFEYRIGIKVFGSKPVSVTSEVTSGAVAIGKGRPDSGRRNAVCHRCFGCSFDELAVKLKGMGGSLKGDYQIKCGNPDAVLVFVECLVDLFVEGRGDARRGSGSEG